MEKVITIWIGEKAGKRPKLPYTDTEIPFSRSLAEIKALLQKFKCERIVDFEETTSDPELPTRHVIGFEKDGMKYMIEFPITYVEHSKGKRLNMGVSGRIIYNRIKAQLTDIEIGYLTFQEAMMPHLLLPTEHGVSTVMEIVKNNVEDIKRGTHGVFLLTTKLQ